MRSAAECSSQSPTGRNTVPTVPPEFTGGRKQKVNGKGGLVWTVREMCIRDRRSAMRYDREGDEHYDIVSAYQKSMRGSDTDAALHYLARLLESGDLPSACRRLMVCACEDVGLAYPQVIPIVKACVDAALQVGLPEARIPLADAVVLVCQSPKSNTAYLAINAAIADVQKDVYKRQVLQITILTYKM